MQKNVDGGTNFMGSVSCSHFSCQVFPVEITVYMVSHVLAAILAIWVVRSVTSISTRFFQSTFPAPSGMICNNQDSSLHYDLGPIPGSIIMHSQPGDYTCDCMAFSFRNPSQTGDDLHQPVFTVRGFFGYHFS